jgi:hypothetical protein
LFHNFFGLKLRIEKQLENEIDENDEDETNEKKPETIKANTDKQPQANVTTKVTTDSTQINGGNNVAKALLKNLPKQVEADSKIFKN